MNLLKKTTIIALFLGLMFACGGKKTPQIPNTANAVVTFDLKKILGKSSDMVKILKDKKFLENFPESETFMEILPMLIDGGFDETQRIYFYTNTDVKKPENGYLGMHIVLKDEKKWAETIQKSLKSAPKKADGLNYIFKKPLLLAWQNGVLWGSIGDKTENELLKQVVSWTNIPAAESFTTKNPEFAETQKNTHDIQVWTNTRNATESLSLYFLPEDLKNQANDDVVGVNVATNFENGGINMDFVTYFAKGKSEKYTKLIRTNLDKMVLNDNAVANPKVFLGGAFNMEGIITELKKQKTFDKESRNFKKDTGVELLSVLQSITGDFAFALEDINFSKILFGGEPVFDFSVKIKDKKIFEDMMRNERASEMYKKIGDNVYEGVEEGNARNTYIFIANDMLHIAGTKKIIEKAKDKKGELGKNSVITSITQNQNVLLYFDLVQLLKGTEEISSAFEPAQKTFKSLTLGTGGIQKDKDMWKAQLSLRFTDEKTNAIPTLYQLFLQTQEANKKAEKEAEEKRKKLKETAKDGKPSDDDFEKFLKEGEGKLEKPEEQL